MGRSPLRRLIFVLPVLALTAAAAAGTWNPDHRPDYLAFQHYGPAYRFPQAGWTVLHIEGATYERGYQHGRLMPTEIAAAMRCFAALQSSKAPSDGWKNARALVNALFVRRYEKEYLEEMQGIADGATAAGARFDNRPIDLTDIVTLNAWPEIETLGSALEATPTGLEGVRFPHPQPHANAPPKPMHCSAFAATGPATADGKVVFGHITMFGLYPSSFYNVWLDVKPAKGHRVLMQTYPGGIQSGLDYYMNDVGILVCETTISQTKFDITGTALASRIRQALQYADSIDAAVEVLKKGNNGLYTNEWLLADTKTNEIAMFELGTAKSKLYRSSKNEWFGNTPGFYWGCNNTKDIDVRLETVAAADGRPVNVVWRPSERDKTWLRLYEKHKGKIGVAFGKEAFTTPPVAASHSLDAKFTTTDLAKELRTWALFGPPLGRTWHPTEEEMRKFPEVRPLVSNPWTVLDILGPNGATYATKDHAVDLKDRVETGAEQAARAERHKPLPTKPAWHGTLLPKTDADIWLAAAFADYEKIVSQEKAFRERAKDGQLTAHDRSRLAVEMFSYRTGYTAGTRRGGDVPLADTKPAFAGDDWYRVAVGKGVWLLHELRGRIGDEAFEKAMDSFGREHAGRAVTAAEFQAHVEQAVGKSLAAFFDAWLKRPGLPQLRIGEAVVQFRDGMLTVSGELLLADQDVGGTVEVALSTDEETMSKRVSLTGPRTAFTFEMKVPEPRKNPEFRLTVDPNNWAAKAAGGAYSIASFQADLEHTLIVYGTADEEAANRETAEALQKSIRERRSNITVPVKSDKEVTEADLKGHHLLLIGRPDSNGIVKRFQNDLPLQFRMRRFSVFNKPFQIYVHAGSAVLAAAANPLAPRYSMVVLAGNSAEATTETPAALLRRHSGEVVVLPHGGESRALVIPPRELVRDLADSLTRSR